jgi:hypothetical protein
MDLTEFFQERIELQAFIEENYPESLSGYQVDLAKVMVIAAASSFEEEVIAHILELFNDTNSPNTRASFVKRKALDRQYHQLFDWEQPNANKFARYFGDDCARTFKEQVNTSDWLEQSVRDFLAIGHQRNLLVHGNFPVYALELTPLEVRDKYFSARKFVAAIPGIIRMKDASLIPDNPHE